MGQAWHEFYQDVRLCLPDDDYLVQQLEASWGIAEKGRKPTKSEIDAVILQLRSALTQRSHRPGQERRGGPATSRDDGVREGSPLGRVERQPRARLATRRRTVLCAERLT